MKKSSIIYIILAVALFGLIVWASRGPSLPDAPGDANGDIPAAAMILESDHSKGGNDTAPATLIEYGDFQCPACAAYADVVTALGAEFGRKLQIVFRNYPLTQIHRNANAASAAAEAAGNQGKFWEMHDLLFGRQSQWSNLTTPEAADLFADYARELNLNLERYNTDVTSDAVKQKVAADVRSGNDLGVRGTPTFILNGKKLQNPGTPEDFIALINAEIGDAEVAPLSEADISQNETVHEHADFALFLNGQQFDFGKDEYQSDEPVNEDPQHEHNDELTQHDPYVHIHDGVGSIIHKHKAGVTMGYFFETLGFELSDLCIKDDKGNEYCAGDGNSLKFFVNGKRVPSLVDYEFNDLDQILISYGPLVDTTVTAQLGSITDEACIYSETCPERGEAPTENCVGGLGTDCTQ